MGLFFEIAIAIILAGIFGCLAKITRQPLFLAYIFTGIILGPTVLNIIRNQETILYLSSLGIAFLLFTVGLELDFKKLKGISFLALTAGLGQIAFTGFFGFLLVRFFHFNFLPALYIALALTFSSTSLIVKLYSEKKELTSLHGKIILGILIIQDMVAILALILLRGIPLSTFSFWAVTLPMSIALLKGLGLFLFTLLSARFLIPVFFKFIARSIELLFLVSLGWCLALTLLALKLGLSIEIGAFLAGMSLAATPYNLEIIGHIKPLRDFFVIIFFIALGFQLVWQEISQNWFLVILLSLFVLIGNPLILMSILGALGLRKRTSFLTSLSCAQISEFSLILVMLGNSLGHLDLSVISLITMVAIVTFTLSSYLIIYDNKIYVKIAKYLNIFERQKKIFEEIESLPKELSDHIILFGCDRMGSQILKKLIELKEKFLVIDFNPDIIRNLKKQNINAIYGDAEDPEIIERINFTKAKMIISTIPDFETSKVLLKKNQTLAPKQIIYVTAEDAYEALALYQNGADYVILPRALSGKYISILLKELGDKKENLILKKEFHIKELKTCTSKT